MRRTILKMKKQLHRKEAQLKCIEDSLQTMGEGRLKIQRRNGRVYYFNQRKSDTTGAWEQTYLGKKEKNLVKELAQKEYCLKVRKALVRQINLISKFIESYDENDVEELYSNLSQERKELIQPIDVGLKEALELWYDEEYEEYQLYAENRIYETNQGEMVRSKSEVIIANTLYQNRNVISYKYERPLQLHNKGGKIIVIHPDFTVINKMTGEIFYYEHAGCMDEPKYAVDFVNKINLYANNNILQGKNLFVTYETCDMPLDIGTVKNVVQHMIACS